MSGQKNYFGKDSIRPDFLNPKKTLSAAETNAHRAPTSKANDLESNPQPVKSLYVGQSRSGPTRRRSQTSLPKQSNPKNFFNNIRKKFRSHKTLYFAPLALIAIIAIVFIFIFSSTSFLGPHISALFTDSTNTDYTAYNLRTNEVIVEILSGSQKMPDYLRDRFQKEGITTNNDHSLSFNGNTITAANFETSYNNNADFREAVIRAHRGRAATFFDSAAETFYKKLGLSRDVLHDYQTTGNAESDTANYDQIMTEYFDVQSNSTIETATNKTTTDSNGNKITTTSTSGTVSSNSFSSADTKARASEFLDAVGNEVESSSTSCAARTTGDTIATAVASNAKYTYANTFMTIMESISKAMAGEANSSGINNVLNWFTKPETATVHNPTTGQESQVTGTPLEAQSVRAVLSGLPIDQSKTQDYSLERAFVATDSSINNSDLFASPCDDQTDNIALSLNAQGTPGSNFVRTTIGALLNTTVGSGFRITASSTLSLLIPSISDVLYSNAYQSAVGVSGGELFGMGAANVNQLAAQQNSGATGASKEQVLAYNQANNIVLAQQAEIDQKNHSPFDTSNPHTFLGSVASSFIPLATTTSTAFVPISTFSSISTTALANINPTYAAGENTSYLTNFGDNCQKSNSIGAVSNVYCNMIAVNDLSTINIPENDPAYQKVISESIDYIDGKEVVREGSPLADFITYWTGRYSMPGIYDANIASACEENRTGNIPILSSVISMIKPVSEYCRSVADGSRYINSSSNPYWATEKYHQLWVLNARVKENLGFYQNSTNPLTAYREQYDQNHPLDNSRSGYLARISGLSKYDAETVIALFDYYQKVADYHPQYAYQFAHQANSPFSPSPTDISNQYSYDSEDTALTAISAAATSLIRREETSA